MNVDRHDNSILRCGVLVIGAGVAGLNCALHLPRGESVFVVSKGGLKSSDSFLAQGGICVLRDGGDFDGYFEDTMRAGHYENDADAVRCMIENSRATINELISFGVRFRREKDGSLAYTREGAHSRPRIVFHADCTGKEITSHLLKEARLRENIRFFADTTMLDLIADDNNAVCLGAVLRDNRTGEIYPVKANAVVLATGGVGGLYRHSTNFRILTGDGLAVCMRHGVALQNADYVQHHPTTLYSEKRGRRFLISESVRGEGATLVDKNGKRFVDELLPRDVVTAVIRRKMEEEGTKFVRLALRTCVGGASAVGRHFPSIVARCRKEGYDVFREPIPVVPAQHYYMGGIKSDLSGRTSMKRLYAVGETCCNGVHGKNRLASNSLLESLIFAKRAAEDITKLSEIRDEGLPAIDYGQFLPLRTYSENHKKMVREVVRGEKQ